MSDRRFSAVSQDAADAGLTWRLDRLHYPDPVGPLEHALVQQVVVAGTNVAFAAFGMPVAREVRRVCTYLYWMTRSLPIEAERAGEVWGGVERTLAREAATIGARWRQQALPEVLDRLASWEAFDLSGAAAPALVEHFDAAIAGLRRLHELRTRSALPAYLALSNWDDLFRAAFPDRGALDGLQALQGLPSATSDAADALRELVDVARASAAVRSALARERPTDARAELERSPEGRLFAGAVERYLDAHGHVAEKLGFAGPFLVEVPEVVIGRIAAQLRMDGYGAERPARGGSLERWMSDVLGAAPEGDRERLERALRSACEAAPVIEDKGRYIDGRCGYQMRRIVLELGSRLAGRGALAGRDDVWQLTPAEATEALLAAAAPSLDDRVRERSAELERFAGIRPPEVLGAAPRVLAAPASPLARSFTKLTGEPPPQPSQPTVVRGIPASRGRARGTARVVRSLGDATRVRPGDVLVTETTAPPWTPLFATVAALVTDMGGVLSHGAIVAREHGIPAVVGTSVATTAIADGQMVQVDGDAGEVRLIAD